jgi:hypothetical protein
MKSIIFSSTRLPICLINIQLQFAKRKISGFLTHSIYLFIRKKNGEKPDLRSKINFTTDLILKTGEQKIDVVLDNPAMHGSEFLKTIYRTGIILC